MFLDNNPMDQCETIGVTREASRVHFIECINLPTNDFLTNICATYVTSFHTFLHCL